MFLHWRANLADQKKQQPLKTNIRVTYHTFLSVWNKPLIDTCQHCSTNRANQALRSLANAGFQNRGVCLQAFPSFPSPSPHFHFLALVSFLARPKPRIPFLGLSLLRNQTEMLATQASTDWSRHVRNLRQPIRSTTQIRVVSRHQYGISSLVCQTSFRGKTVVASRNAGCFLRLQVLKPAMLFYQREPRDTCTNHFDVCHLSQHSFSFCRLKLWTCLIRLTASQSLSPANG